MLRMAMQAGCAEPLNRLNWRLTTDSPSSVKTEAHMKKHSNTSGGWTCALAATGLMLSSALLTATADDWPRWRGPNANGIIESGEWNPEALNDGPRITWQKELGEGYSAATISGKRLYTLGNVKNRDTVFCLDADNGSEIWKYNYACKARSYSGPRSTPLAAGTSVYTFSREGHIFCFNAANGEVKWKRNVATELKAKVLRWGFAGSPIMLDEKIIINAGKRGVALDRTTGRTIWSSAPGVGGYATPVIYRQAGKICAAIFGEKGLHAVDTSNGKELWYREWETRYNVNAADPIISGTKMFISSGYKRGSTVLDFSGKTPRTLWKSKSLSNMFSSSVLLDGYIYGIDGNAGRGTLRCLVFDTGAEKWSKELGFGSLIVVDRKLIVLNEKGTMFIADAVPTGYRQVSEAKILQKKVCWTAPAFAYGKIYCRNQPGTLVCVDVRK